MGHKVHPTGFRLGIIKEWESKWFSETHYAEFVQEDNRIRQAIKARYREAAISRIEIDRQAKDITITLHTARPGIVIGRGGQHVEEMRQFLEGLTGKKIRLNILEVRQPELDAYLVARSVAEQIERRVAYRRAMKQAIFRTMQAGAHGIKISCAGRLANAEIARRQTMIEGRVPLHTIRADIDYGFTEAHTTLGRIGVKVWIYKGQVMPEPKAEAPEEKPQAQAETAEAATEAAPTEEKPAELQEKLKKIATVRTATEAKTEVKKDEEKAEKPSRPPVGRAKEKPAEKPAERPVKKAAAGAPAAEAGGAEAKETEATPAKKTRRKVTTEKTATESTEAKKPAAKSKETSREE